MAYTIVGYAGGTQVTLGASTATEALQQIDAMRRFGARFRTMRDQDNRSFTEEDVARLAADEYQMARTKA